MPREYLSRSLSGALPAVRNNLVYLLLPSHTPISACLGTFFAAKAEEGCQFFSTVNIDCRVRPAPLNSTSPLSADSIAVWVSGSRISSTPTTSQVFQFGRLESSTSTYSASMTSSGFFCCCEPPPALPGFWPPPAP